MQVADELGYLISIQRTIQTNSTRILTKILADKHAGNIVFISRIPLSPSSTANLPFDIQHTQFPLQLAFAMTINKVKP